MSLNILTYLIYTTITAYITLKVGWMFYTNGAHYLIEVFAPDTATAHHINKLLLIGYYLLNLGYLTVSIGFLPPTEDITHMISLISDRSGTIIIVLGIMHYLNMLWVRILKMYMQPKQYL